MNLYYLLSQLRQFIKVLKNSIIDGADKFENVCSVNVTPLYNQGDNYLRSACMHLDHLLSQLRQSNKVLKNSITDGAHKLKMCLVLM